MNRPSLAIPACALVVSAFLPLSAWANGCIVVRPSTQLAVNLDDAHESKAGRFEFSSSYRYLYSDRHFRGREEEENRQAEGSDVRNRVHTLTHTLTWFMDDKWRFSASLPYVTADRSSLYEHDRVNRHTMSASGIGDLQLMAYRQVLQSSEGAAHGLTFGLGLKLPTGEDDATDIAHRPEGPERRHVDQSIQPGDGGFGLIAEVQAYRQFFDERTLGFFTASYLINPRDTNGVTTHRRRANEAVMSVPDTYQLRTGFTRLMWPEKGISLDAALRVEGSPADDLVGDSNGFRRPGYAIYLEPAFNLQRGPHRLSISAPVAIERNRTRSRADRENGTHGDAAFADYLVMGSYSFGW